MNANPCASMCCVIIVWLPSHLDLFMGHPLPLGLLAGWSKTHYSNLGLRGVSQLPEGHLWTAPAEVSPPRGS